MFLDVGNRHKIHFEEYGNREGINILFLHGGPGLGFSDNDKVFFDPKKFHVVFIDQRGCGKSTPKGTLDHNTTKDLVSDIVLVLNYLKIDSVILFGGSWGATLAILFAAAYPEKVNKIILRGFFSATKLSTDIYLRGKIKTTHPKNWDRVSSFVPQLQKGRIAEHYFESIKNRKKGFERLGYEWARYGLSLSRKQISEHVIDQTLSRGEVDFDRIGIELNYALNGFFIPEGYVYDQADKIKKMPITIIHGIHDYICPVEDAKQLASIFIAPKVLLVDGGHSASEHAIKEALLGEMGRL